MARRGKTVIKQGPEQKTMMRALEQGEAAVHRASESLRQQQNIDYQDRRQFAADIGQAGGAIQRKFKEEEQEDYERGLTTQKMTTQKEQFEQQLTLREKEATSRAAQSQQRTDLAAAAAGRQRAGPTQDPLLQREQQVKSEMQQGQPQAGQPAPGGGTMAPSMPPSGVDGPPPEDPADRGRQHIQMDKALGDSPFPLTKEGRRTRAFEERAAQSKWQTDRMRAAAQLQNATTSAKKAIHTGNKEDMVTARKVLQVPLGRWTGGLNAIMSRKPMTPDDKKYLMRETQGHPVHEEVKAWDGISDPSPGLLAHINHRIDRETLNYFERVGESPDSKYVNWTSPAMIAFMGVVSWTNAMAKTTGMGGYRGVENMEERNRIVLQMSATLAKQGLTMPGALPQEGERGPAQAPMVARQGLDEQGRPQTQQTQKLRGTTPEEAARAKQTGLAPEGEQKPFRPLPSGQQPAAKAPFASFDPQMGAGYQ